MKKGDIYEGIIRTNGKGFGFVEIDPELPNVYIDGMDLNTSLPGDKVKIEILSIDTRGPRGKVARILERHKMTFVGTLEKNQGDIILVPDDRRMYVPIIVPSVHAADIDMKAQAKITDFKRGNWPTGEILRIIGKKGDNDAEMEAIVLEAGFESSHPADVVREAEKYKERFAEIIEEERKVRRDMSETLTFTIDPADAKDFDDALSFKKLPDNKYEIGVHIADVSYFVRPGTRLDEEAIDRATSIYLVDRTIPMLPEVLSNDLCSLNPNVPRLTFSAIFEMDITGKVYKRWFGRTIINSAKRFTYEEAQEIIEKPAGEFGDVLTTMNTMAKSLQKEKMAGGAIEFEQPEVKFKLDEKGKPIGVYLKERKDAHRMIEDFMLLANREVAKFVYDETIRKGGRDTGMIYRIHDVPDAERLELLRVYVRAFGHELPPANQLSSKDIVALIKKIEGHAEESLITTATLRTMAKAIYSTKNIGHFGLGFTFYTHFTSPIRRYPDLLVHRVLEKHLKNEPFGQNEAAKLQSLAEHSTEREIEAAKAERESIRMKQVEYMQERIGNEYEGTISGVTEFGMYIEEPTTKAEGMIKTRDMTDDYYTLDEKNYRLVGEKTKKKYALGDKVRFKVVGADIERRMLDFSLIK